MWASAHCDGRPAESWNHVLDEGPNPPWEGAILKGKGWPVKYREYRP